MKAIRIHNAGSSEVLQYEECEIPLCGPDEILVQMKAAGINFIDIYIRTAFYKTPPYPFILGKEGSGIVAAIGSDVHDFKVGDRVAFCMSESGSYAEYAKVRSQQLVIIPDTLSFDVAAAMMLQGLTAYYLSHRTFPLRENDVTLVHAGAGGVGLLLIQMAKLLKASVITTVSTAEKAALAKNAGADEVVDYTQQSFLEKVMAFTHNGGVQVVYDSVGQTTFDDSLKSLMTRGMLVSYGQSSGPIPPFNLSRLAEKSLYLTRPVLAHYTTTKAELNGMATELFSMIENKKLAITIGQRYALADARKAHDDLENRRTIGKSILIME